MGRLVHTGLGSSSLVAHVLHHPLPHANSFVIGTAVINTHTHAQAVSESPWRSGFRVGMCATLQLFFALDGELGDLTMTPWNGSRTRSASIYISITASRVGSSAVCQHASFNCMMIFLAARSFRSSNFPSFF
jgi:hypothetical protein